MFVLRGRVVENTIKASEDRQLEEERGELAVVSNTIHHLDNTVVECDGVGCVAAQQQTVVANYTEISESAKSKQPKRVKAKTLLKRLTCIESW